MIRLPHVYRHGATAGKCLASCIARIDARDADVHAWAELDLAGAQAAAAQLDAEAAAGNYRSPLHGLPLGVKDLLDVAGLPTRAGSASRANVAPAITDSPLVAALRAAGCVIVGKTHTTEFAYLDPTVTVNPFNPLHTPGGSSSGSGAAVGAGMVPLALGTQTVGSVCRPAAYCGAAAFKPTTGSTPMHGVVPFSPTYDTLGFLAADFELAFDAWRVVCAAGVAQAGVVMGAGRDAGIGAGAGTGTLTGSGTPSSAPLSLDGLRFATPTDNYFAQLERDVQAGLDHTAELLKQAGATPVQVTLDVDLASMRGLQRTVMFYEAARAHRGLQSDPAVFGRLGRHWRDGLAYGATISQDEHDAANAALRAISEAVLRQMAAADFLLLPAASSTAPTKDSTGDPAMILPWTIFGTPLAVLPLGLSDQGLPLGVMLAGRPHHDGHLAAVARTVQSLIGAGGGGYPGPAPW